MHMVLPSSAGRIDASRVKAVVFDLDDTLVNWRQAEAQAISLLAREHFAPLGFTAVQVRDAYAEVMAENVRSWRELRRWWYVSERLQLLADRLEVADRLPGEFLGQAFSREVSARLALLDGALPAMRLARTGGRKTAILTNGRGETQRPKVLSFALDVEVDFVGISGELGAWKPDAAAFQLVLAKLRVEPEDAVMVGDSHDFDIAPAKALGMQTVWVSPLGETSPHADLSIPGVHALAGHLTVAA
jgi:putative hydrolase of the HAD superfamily